MGEIEEEFRNQNALKMWRAIDERDPRFREEDLVKKIRFPKRRKKTGATSLEMKEKETELDLVVNASRLFVFLWIVIGLIMIIWGEAGKAPFPLR